ncbi:MAG: hypothetical protein NT051_01850 [Candidatus Micrarchaeota archaeon]|nr:hypothetical protein [Candidatus Micrarchaeota archaeon]
MNKQELLRVMIIIEVFLAGMITQMGVQDVLAPKAPRSEKQKYSHELNETEKELESRIKNADRMLDTATIAQPEHCRADAFYILAKKNVENIECPNFMTSREHMKELRSINKERIVLAKRNLDSLESILYRKMKVEKSEYRQLPMKHMAPLKR